jgi:hypothetical protein
LIPKKRQRQGDTSELQRTIYHTYVVYTCYAATVEKIIIRRQEGFRTRGNWDERGREGRRKGRKEGMRDRLRRWSPARRKLNDRGPAT